MQPVRTTVLADHSSRSTSKCCTGARQSIPLRSAVTFTDDFLKQTFLPVCDTPLPCAAEQKAQEEAFFKSLQHLQTLYGICPADRRATVYPYNIWLAYREVQQQLKGVSANLSVYICEVDRLPVLCTANSLDMGYDLFYIPIYPLYDLLITACKGELADLLLSAFAYLHYAGVSLCGPNSYIGYEMQTVKNYVEGGPGEWETEDEFNAAAEHMTQVISHCTRMCRLIRQKKQLRKFAKRLKQVQADNPKEQALVNAIADLFKLYQSFPDNRFTDHLHSGFIDPHTEERIYPEQYLSFYWGANSWFDQQITDCINNTMQEIITADQPLTIQLFNTAHTSLPYNLEFETRLLHAIDQLNTALYAY